ncbi:MAG: DUF333 domain-containing protein [Candidatus Nanoarchaeia archaeon]|nr:DUF333 domain-containing protein [Candidatus Nanoarchaeia archaeon]
MEKNFLFLVAILLVAGCTQLENNAGIANPSASFCIDSGFTYEIRETPIGQNGYCVFEDGSECEAWAFFREECTIETASPCKYLCGDGICQEIVCEAVGCPCAESFETCPSDCSSE